MAISMVHQRVIIGVHVGTVGLRGMILGRAAKQIPAQKVIVDRRVSVMH